MRALGRGLRGEQAVAGQDADLETLDAGEAADQGLAVQLLELLEAAVVSQAGDDLAAVAGVVARARQAQQFLRVVAGRLDGAARPAQTRRLAEMGRPAPMAAE